MNNEQETGSKREGGGGGADGEKGNENGPWSKEYEQNKRKLREDGDVKH